MAQPGVLMKVGGLLVKTLAKPVARQLKVDAEHVGWLREYCCRMGQTTNYLTNRISHASSLDKWKKPYRHVDLKNTEALEKGSEILSEGFVLTVAVSVMGYEYNRQTNYKAAAEERKAQVEAGRRADVEARLEALEATIRTLHGELAAGPAAPARRRQWLWSP